MRILDTDAHNLKAQAQVFEKNKPAMDKAINQEKQRSYRGAGDVTVEEWQKMLNEYLRGATQIELSDRYGIKAQVIGHRASQSRWSVKRARFEAAEAKKEASKLKGMAAAGKASVEERKELEAVQTDKAKKAQAIAKSNERTALLLDRTMEIMALSLGITDADYQIFEENPALMMQKVKEIATDKDLNANFIRLFDKFKEAVVLKRLVIGQSTSAANREDPIDSDDQERVIISLAEVKKDEVEEFEQETLNSIVDEVVQGNDLDFL